EREDRSRIRRPRAARRRGIPRSRLQHDSRAGPGRVAGRR
ncbi:MAG: hypothetical protein AVDCRST_MAG01-01-4552, partial [uncultured Rubrobacteraceae bacterium]